MSFEPVLFPVVALEIHRRCYSFGVVAHATAAECQDPIDLIIPRDTHALMQFLERRVGHHAQVFNDGLAAVTQDSDYLIVDAVAFDATASVVEQHALA